MQSCVPSPSARGGAGTRRHNTRIERLLVSEDAAADNRAQTCRPEVMVDPESRPEVMVDSVYRPEVMVDPESRPEVMVDPESRPDSRLQSYSE
ncbi:unnamed protein product [Merluccius merluccius]